jgi:tripartite-type tricarboxylate transporter receptor subunit TctC
MNPKLPYDAIKDFTFLGRTGRSCLALVISPKMPVKTLSEFLAYARANPGKINFASPGISTTGHLAGLVFAKTAAIQMTHIPYRGEGAALMDLMSGAVQAGFFAGAKPHVDSGALRVIAVAPPTECDAWPGVLPIAKTLPTFEGSGWANSQGFAAPAGLPRAIRDKIVAAMNQAIGTERVKKGIRNAGYGDPGRQDPDEYAAAVTHEIDLFKSVVAEYGLKEAE